MKNRKNIFKRTVLLFCMAVLFCNFLYPQTVFADTKKSTAKESASASESSGGKFGDSKLAKGTTDLISDVTAWISVAAIAGGSLLGLYFWGRKAAAGEQDQARWEKALKRLGICIIGIVSTSSTISLIISYYK